MCTDWACSTIWNVSLGHFGDLTRISVSNRLDSTHSEGVNKQRQEQLRWGHEHYIRLSLVCVHNYTPSWPMPSGDQNLHIWFMGHAVIEISQKYVLLQLILFFQVGTNIPHFLKLLEEDLLKNKENSLRKQPFVLVLGDMLSPKQTFLMVERLAIPYGSTIAALDACFKAFYVLNVEYPVACKNTWRFLQHGCYKLEGGEKEIVPTVRSLITAFHK